MTVTISLMLAGLGSPAQAALDTGTITGQLTEAGAPVADAHVFAYDSSGNSVSATHTDGEGRYSFDVLPAGEYRIQFVVPGLVQWAHQKMTLDEADRFPVAAGETTVVNEVLLPTGSLAGTLTDSAGPVAGVSAVVELPNGGTPSATTDDQGRFLFPRLLPGQYRLWFELPGSAIQYYPGTLDLNGAVPVTITAGERTEITDTLLPTGSVSGRVVEDGAPVEGANVMWQRTDSLTAPSAWTDADGRYALPRVFTGAYRVQILLPDGRMQWAHGKLDEQTADQFTVAAGAETVLDETVLPTGQVRVRATNARTGAAVTGFCAEVRNLSGCTEGEVAEFAKVPVGQHPVTVFPFTNELLTGRATVDVVAGETAQVTVALQPAAFIVTTIRDRRTGAPVEGACLDPIRLVLASLPDGGAFCSDAEGRVRVRIHTAGTYTLFASVADGVHGVQWVGGTGGTGSQLNARKVSIELGQTVTLPPVLLDGAGSISGRVTDKATGAPAVGTVSLLTWHPGGGPNGPRAEIGADGRYTVTGLGPYEWPLYFRSPGHAPQWSGGAQSRLLATPVKVTAGRTATYDAKLSTGTTVRGTITVGGQPLFGGGWTVAYDAVLGDVAGVALADDSYTMLVLGPTAIRINVQGGDGLDRWHVDAADFQHATSVLVPSSGTITVNLAFS